MRTLRPLAALLDALYPPRCAACGRLGWSGEALCRACLEDWPVRRARCRRCGRRGAARVPHPDGGLPGCMRCAAPLAVADAFGRAARRAAAGVRLRPAALAEVRVGAAYAGTPRQLILGLKHRGAFGGLPLLGRGLEAALEGPRVEADLVVPMPQDPWRGMRRGLHPARELAAPIARALDLPLRPRLLRVRLGSGSQARRSRAERLRAPRGRFVVRARDVQGAALLLVDDVLTSGGTAWAAARTLRRAGAARITLAVACRADYV